MEQKKLWDYFQGEGSQAFDGNYPRLRYLLTILTPYEKKILNIGVGNGAFERLAIKQKKDIYSLDPSEIAIEKLISELQMKNKAYVGFSQNIPFPDAFFDAVVISEVLEHLEDSVLYQTLQEIKRVLKIGGKIIGSVPLEENLQEQQVMCPCCGKQFHRWGHVQSFDIVKLEKILKNSFNIIELHKKNFICWQLLNFKGKLFAFTKLMLFAFGIYGRGGNLVFIASKQA